MATRIQRGSPFLRAVAAGAACLVLGATLFFAASGALAATYISKQTGNWNAGTTWARLRTGTITTNAASTTVTGVGTLFTTELAVGNQLFTAAGALIGTIASFTSPTQLTLTANAASTNAGIPCYATTATTPVAADVVTINPHTITITAAAAAQSVTFPAPGGAANLTHNAGIALAVGAGGVTINGSSNTNSTKAWNINDGSATVAGNVTLAEGNNNNRIARINLTSGPAPNAVLSIQGNLTFTAGTAARVVINMAGGTASGTINLGGAFTINTTGTLDMGVGAAVFNYNGSAAQTVRIGVSAIVYRNLHLNNSNAAGATLSAAISAANVTGNVRVQSGILNNGGFAMVGGAGGTFEVANGARLNLTAATTMATGFATRTFGPTSTVSYGGAAQAVASGVTYGHLILEGAAASTKTPAAGTITVAGNFTVQGTSTTYQGTNNPAVNLAGNFTNNATTFNSGTGTYTFNSASATAQTLTGATTFTNVTVANTGTGAAAGLSLASNITVTTAAAGVLRLTSGTVTTGANIVIVPRACNTPSVLRTSGFVVGNLRKAIPAAISSCTFEVGSGTNYTPVVLGFTVAPTVAGSITASTTGTEHASIASSGIDPAKSVNRYWTLTNVGVTPAAAGFTATFNFINGSPLDYDAAGTPANFIVERWNGTSWFPTTLNAVCTATPATNLCKQVNALTAAMFGDFAIGEAVAGFNASPGAFNVFETTTPAGVLGRLFTKRLGAGAFAVSIVAVSNNAVNTTPSTAALTVDVIDASPTGGTLTAASNCRTTWTTVIQTQTVPAVVAWASGRVNVSITAPTQAVRNARIRVTQGGNVGCSTDNFTIRPQAFTVTSTDAFQTDTSGTPIIKTGANFNLTAASVAGYDGTPSFDNTKVVGTPTAGTIGGSFGAAPVGSGTASGASFFYSEVGSFGLNANAVYDTSFTGVDQPNDCTADFSNALAGGKYGCSFGSTAVAQTTGTSGFGRFIPDNFDVAYTTPPIFGTACASGNFTYVGQTFTFPTAVMTVTARNGTNNGLTNATTVNYAGAYVKFSNAVGTSLNQVPYNNQDGRYSRFDALGGGTTPTRDTSGLPLTTADPVIRYSGDGFPSPPPAGQVTLTFGSGTGLFFTRTTPRAPFNADIALALNVIDSDAVAFAGNPASFGAATATNGIAFSSGKELRFGRLRTSNANGSQLVPLSMPVETQHWNGTSFITNIADSCTTLAATNLTLGNYQSNLNACETSVTVAPSPFASGRSTVRFSAPGSANNGSVDVTVNLGAIGTGNSCIAGASTPATGANRLYLQGNWTGGAFDQNPTSRATFGVYKGAEEIIYFRENF